MNDFVLYETEDGAARIELRVTEGTVWLSQSEIAALFDVSADNVGLHLRNIYAEAELDEGATTEESSVVRSEGARQVRRTLKLYNLDAILAIGYRVRSPRGSQFRRWANTILKEYLIKGFAMDDARLSQAERWDYFDEWLARIRDIRASEKRFYQKIRDLYTTAIDYDASAKTSALFFSRVQNKMLWAVTGKTAAELLVDRADPNRQNMGLTSWRGTVVRKGDVGTAKNYLGSEEVAELNRIVTMYLDYAEDQATRRQPVTMAQWMEKLDAFLSFNERDLLTHAGSVKAEVARRLTAERFEIFDAARKAADARAADALDLSEMDALERRMTGKGGD